MALLLLRRRRLLLLLLLSGILFAPVTEANAL
jgi:hypothetical protein